jgi:hypothetical protein
MRLTAGPAARVKYRVLIWTNSLENAQMADPQQASL